MPRQKRQCSCARNTISSTPLLIGCAASLTRRSAGKDGLGASGRGSRATGGASLSCRSRTPPLAVLVQLLVVDALDVLFNVFDLEHLQRLSRLHDSNLNVLGTSLDNFEQRLDRELDRLFAIHAFLVIALEELAHRL